MNTVFYLIGLAAIFLAAGYFLGFALGRDRGHDEQFCADWFARQEQERARRDELGRFRRAAK